MAVYLASKNAHAPMFASCVHFQHFQGAFSQTHLALPGLRSIWAREGGLTNMSHQKSHQSVPPKCPTKMSHQIGGTCQTISTTTSSCNLNCPTPPFPPYMTAFAFLFCLNKRPFFLKPNALFSLQAFFPQAQCPPQASSCVFPNHTPVLQPTSGRVL